MRFPTVHWMLVCVATFAALPLAAGLGAPEPALPENLLTEGIHNAPCALEDDPVPVALYTRPTDPSDDEGGDAIPPFDNCGGIRPGARMSAPYGCTFNFVYSGGGNLYIGTAGHCTDNVGQRVSAAGVGQFGTVVFRTQAGLGSDFALIQIDAGRVGQVDSTLCAWGGPTQAHNGGAATGSVLKEYGWGVATQFHAQLRAREVFLTGKGATSAQWAGVGSGGDSGAPLITNDGQAFAIHTHGITPVVGVVGEAGTYIQRALSLAAGAGFSVAVVPG